MAVPKKKTSKSRRNMRRSHHSLNLVNVVEDPTTGQLKRPHHVSPDGYYRGRQVTADKVNP
jgi:large subunit ribosomal protein L32